MQTQEHVNSQTKLPAPTDSVLGAPLVVSPKLARGMLNVGHTQLYQLINAGDLQSYCDGKSRKIVVASIHEYIKHKLKAA